MDETKTSDAANFMKAMILVAFGLLCYGIYCLINSPLVRQQAERSPRMTCDQLIQNGAGPDRFVVLTDACLSAGRSVSERDGDTGALELYHPMYPAGLKQEPAPANLGLILCIMDEGERRRTRDDRNNRQQLGQAGLSELTCEVRQGAATLPRWARDGLTAQYPGIPLAACWVATVGKDEPTPEQAQRLLWHGIGSTAAACAMILGWYAWRVGKRLPVTSP